MVIQVSQKNISGNENLINTDNNTNIHIGIQSVHTCMRP